MLLRVSRRKCRIGKRKQRINCKNHGKNSLMIIKRNKSDGTYFYGCSTYEESRKDNCPTLNLEDVPPLYWGMPLFQDKDK